MKIEGYRLKNFVKKASLNGLIPSINIEFKEDGVHSQMVDIGNVAMTSVFLKQEMFEDYKILGELFIKDTDAFMRYLNTFGSHVDIEIVDDYIMLLSDNDRKGEVMLGAEVVCDGVHRDALPNLPLEEKITINKSDLDRSITDMKLLKTDKITIIRNENNLVFEIGESKKADCFKNIINIGEKGTNQQVTVGSYFLKLFESLDSSITIELKSKFPIRITEEKDNMKFICIIAPIIETD